MEKEKKSFGEIFKNCSKVVKTTIVVALVCVVAAVACIIIFAPEGKVEFSFKTALKEMEDISLLSTSECTYNSIAAMPIDPEKEIGEDNTKYHVSYKGTVKYGFDFKKLEVIEKEDSIIVVIPKIEIHSVDVDTNMEYIFVKEKYDKETTYAEAYNLCCDDLEKKARENNTLYTTAIESAVETVTALTKPFEKHLEEGESLKIVYVDNFNIEEAK